MIPEHLLNSTIAVYDIETPYLTDEGIEGINEIYCVGIAIITNGVAAPAKIYTSKWVPGTNGSLLDAMQVLHQADILCAHNGVGFDDQVIKNVLSVNIKPTELDTLIISKIMLSKDELFAIDAQLHLPKDLWASYSLKAFGYRLGDNKIEYEEFDEGLTQTLITYCLQDVNLTARLLLHLASQENFPLPQVIDIEHKAAAIIAEQTAMGFYIDIDKARELNTALLKEKGEIARELAEEFKPKWLKDGPVKTYKKQSTVRIYVPNKRYTPLLGTKDGTPG